MNFFVYKQLLYEFLGQKLKADGVTLEERYCVSKREYAPHGGSYPLTIKNTGIIGTITVSGLPQEEDHALVVSTIAEFLKRKR